MTNPDGKPAKLPSVGDGREVCYDRNSLFTFGGGYDMRICDQPNTLRNSRTYSAKDYRCAFAPLGIVGDFPLTLGGQSGWLMAEAVAFAISVCD